VTYRSSTIVGGLGTAGLYLLTAILAGCSAPAPSPSPSAAPTPAPAAPIAPAGEAVPAPPPALSAPAPAEEQPATAPAEPAAGPDGDDAATASPSPAASPSPGSGDAANDAAEAQRRAAADQLRQKLKAAKTRAESLDAVLKQNCPDLKPGELRHPGAVRACTQLQAQATQAAADYEELKKQAQAAGVSE
jgi:hypothetical protein